METFRLTGGCIFVCINLILLVKVETIFLCLRHLIFFHCDLWRQKMSSVTATPRRVEQLETKSVKVFYWLLISDRAASWDFKLTDDRNFKLGIHFFMKVRGHNFSSQEITAHLVRSKQTTCSALQEVAKCYSCGASEEKISTICSLL